jgi:FkbM family methyltransferase
MPVTPGTLSAQEIRALLGRDDPVIVEVGANCGQTTVDILRAMPRATLYAFEPDPRAIAKFRANVRHPGVRLFECAVGARNGTVTFHQSSGAEDHPDYREAGWDQSGSIRRPLTHLQVWPWVRFEKQIEVPIVTLDEWAAAEGIGPVDFIWADVQGAESDLIAGAARVLRATRFFYTEYSNSEWYEGQVTLPALAGMLPDFELVRVYPMDALFRRRTLT